MELREAIYFGFTLVFLKTALLSYAAPILPQSFAEFVFWMYLAWPADLLRNLGLTAPNFLTKEVQVGSSYAFSFVYHSLTPLGVTLIYWLPGLVFLALFLSARSRRLRASRPSPPVET